MAALAAVPRSTFPLSRSFRRRIDRIGLQLYTVRDKMQADFEGTLARVAQIGYQEVEFAGFFGRSPAQVRALLDRDGLTAPSAHIAYEEYRDHLPAVLDAAHAVGCSYLVCAWIPETERQDLDGWKRVGEFYNRIGAACRAAGMQFAFHNHSYEFVPMAGQLPYDVLLAATDADLVRLEMDLFWIVYGGADPLAYFAKYPGRFPLVHVKDMAKKPRPDVPPDSVMRNVGAGTIDWKAIFAKSEQAGIKHWFVEHDTPGDAFASITASYAYLKQLDF